jgi:hypothetical protein
MADQNRPDRLIAPVVKKLRLSDAKGDAAYWRTRSVQERLAALEEIREEYHRWRGDAQPGLQRVYSIIKVKKPATGWAQDIADIEKLE